MVITIATEAINFTVRLRRNIFNSIAPGLAIHTVPMSNFIGTLKKALPYPILSHCAVFFALAIFISSN
jgi:hypothetical protein